MGTSKRKYDVVVVGAGITGMWAAMYAAKQGKRAALVAPEFIGGLLTSVLVQKRTRGDLGGHVYTTTDSRVVDLLMEAGAVEHERNAVYLGRQGVVPYPVQSHADKLGVTIEAGGAPVGYTLESWALATFGQDFVDKWYRPFNERVWTVELNALANDWVKDRVTPPSASAKWGPNATFLYAPGHEILNVMTDRLAATGRVTTIEGLVTAIDPVQSRALVDYEEIEYDSLVWTAHPRLLTTLVPMAAPTFLANTVATLVAVSTIDPNEFDWHWAYSDVGSKNHRITHLSRYHPSISPKGQAVFVLEAPYRNVSTRPAYTAAIDLAAKPNSVYSTFYIHEEAARQWLTDAGIPNVADWYVTGRLLKFAGYPIPLVGLREQMAALKRSLLAHRIVVAGRWGDWAYFNIDHCMTSAEIALATLDGGDIEPYAKTSFYYGKE